MRYSRLKWAAIFAPVVFFGVLEYARYAFAPVQGRWQEQLLMSGVVLLAAIFFYGAVFAALGHFQSRLEQQNRELEALRNAGLDIASELSLEVVLQKVVDQARNLLGTRFGALSVIDESGEILSFITSGISKEERERIGPLPQGRGLLGVVLREGQRLRLADLSADARSVGFPAKHPDMHSLLAVPVVTQSAVRGNLYLSEKVNGSAFSQSEEETLARFATQAGIALDNANLHAQVHALATAEERLRLAREMHDGQAQILAYVNTQTQVIAGLLKEGEMERAEAELVRLATAARDAYGDVREGILGLRSLPDAEHSFAQALTDYVERWGEQSSLATEVEIEPLPPLTADVELQLLRIAQEALANVRKHADATFARIVVAREGDRVRLTVEDDGKGFDPDTFLRHGRPRFGLATMRERAQAIGASLAVESKIDHGTRVEVIYAN